MGRRSRPTRRANRFNRSVAIAYDDGRPTAILTTMAESRDDDGKQADLLGARPEDCRPHHISEGRGSEEGGAVSDCGREQQYGGGAPKFGQSQAP